MSKNKITYEPSNDMMQKLPTLDEIGRSTNTDKASSFHDYLRTYGELFAAIRNEPVRILEMGVLGGDSLVMWSKYFDHPDASITGIDVEIVRCQPIEDKRVSAIAGSQTQDIAWEAPFDVILDDAGHFASQQIAAFCIYWPKWLKPGGLYIIEDLHTHASPAHCDGKNIMTFLNGICTEIQGKGDRASGKVEPSDKWESIETITFRKGMCILRKRA